MTALPTPVAHADGATCQGRPVSITGTDGATVTGTAGDDVVLTGNAAEVDTLGGDDTVCATGDGDVLIDTGAGDDSVDATADVGRLTTVLGAGSDTYLGGQGYDRVWTGSASSDSDPDVRQRDTAVDTVDTATGNDRVTTGQDGTPDPDQVTVQGSGFGSIVLAGLPSPEGRLVGSHRRHDVALDVVSSSRRAWHFDLARGRVTADGRTERVEEVSSLDVSRLRWVSLDVDGGPRPEQVVGHHGPGQGPVRIDLGSGADYVGADAAWSGDLVGGGGADTVALTTPSGRGGRFVHDVTVSLARGTVDGGPRLRGFEALDVSGARTARVTGSTGRDLVFVDGCRAVVDAGGGDDLVTYRPEHRTCRHSGVDLGLLAHGGKGDDELIGAGTDDTLVGDLGRDRVDGRGGVDRCAAESEIGCERRP